MSNREEGLSSPVTWIMGSSRSGSTWLLEMLGELPGVATIDDPHIAHHLAPWRPISIAYACAEEDDDLELRTLAEVKSGQTSYFFNQRYKHAWRPALASLLAARFSAEADDQVPSSLRSSIVVKEPGSQAAELLLSLLPSSRLIFLLRDGRDVVDSWLAAYRRGSWAISEGAFSAADSERGSLVRWLASVWTYRTRAVRRAYDRQDPGCRVLVRYEDLLAEPAAELARICDLVGIPASRRSLAGAALTHDFEAIPSAAKGDGSPARSASPGLWRENLTASEQIDMHRIMGAELIRNGYAVETALAA